MGLDLEKIKNIKKNILSNLKDELENIGAESTQTERDSLIIIFGGQTKPTQFDLEIKFSSFDDFDFFDIINPITKKVIKRIDKDSLDFINEKFVELEEEFLPKIKKETDENTKRKLNNEWNNEKKKLGIPTEITCKHLTEQQVIEICKQFFNVSKSISSFR